MGGFLQKILTKGVNKLASKPPGPVLKFSSAILENSSKSLGRQGPSAKLMVAMEREAFENSLRRTGETLEPVLEEFRTIVNNPKMNHEFVRQLEHGVRASDPRVARLADWSVEIQDEVYKEALQMKIGGPPRSTNLPHILDFKNFKKQPGYKGAPANPNKTRMGKVYTLEEPRKFDNLNYRQDALVIVDHLKDSFERLEYAKIFGPGWETTGELLKSIAKEGGDEMYARTWWETVTKTQLGTSRYNPVLDVERTITSFEAGTKLSTAVISNVGQPLFTHLVSGTGPFVRGLYKIIRDYGAAKEFGLRSGATLRATLREMKVGSGLEKGGFGTFVLKWTGFSAVETWNRLMSANIGKQVAEESLLVLQKAIQSGKEAPTALRRLSVLGINVGEAMRRGTLTEMELLRAGKIMSNITQDFGNPRDVPLLWRQYPSMRILTLYKQFSFGAIRFMKDHVVKPAVFQGNFGPLLRLSLTFPIAGEILADVKSLARQGTLENRPEGFRRLVDNIAQVGAFGLLEDLHWMAVNSSYRSAVDYLGGPVGQDVNDFVRAFIEPSKIPKEVVKRVPSVGPITARTLFPPHEKSGRPKRERPFTRERLKR